MKKLLVALVLIGVLSFNINTLASISSEIPFYQAEKELRDFMPKLSKLKKEYLESPELMLGIATIYSRHSTSEEEYNQSWELYKNALTLEPDNNAIRSSYVWRLTSDVSGRYIIVFSLLEMKQKYAEENNKNKVLIPSYSDLYEFFEKDDQGHVYISDFNEARETILEKLKPDTQASLSELEIAEKREPENSYYNYLRADLYLNIGKEDEAIKELEIGANKSLFDNHWVQIFDYSNTVLNIIKFPEQYIESLNDIPSPMYGLPSDTKFFELAKNKEEKGQKNEAKRVYESFNKIVNQIRELHISEQANIAKRQKERNNYSTIIKNTVERRLLDLEK